MGDSALRLPEVGETLAGKYAIERALGTGGMAVVYEAIHLRMRQRVAIKMLHPEALESPETAERFDREARAVAQLRGPHVARILDVDATPEGLPYMVMEYLDGHDLAAEMSVRGKLPVRDAVGYVLQVCSAMYEAHALGIVHRDLKPANIYLAGAPGAYVVKVLDFGVSKMLEETTRVTATKVVLGTPAYMSPEQITSAKDVDGRTDIWALGVILYEALTGHLPFEARSPGALASSILHDVPKPLRSLRAEVPSELSAAVSMAMTKEMTERFPDITSFAHALAPFGPTGKWEPPPRPSRHMRAAPIADRASLPAERVRASEEITHDAPRADTLPPSLKPDPPAGVVTEIRRTDRALIAWIALAVAVLALVLFVATR